MVRRSDVDVCIITVKWYARPTILMSSYLHRIEPWHGSDDNSSTARLNTTTTLMNNTIDGSKPAVIINDYRQRLSPMAAKTINEVGFEAGGDELSIVMNCHQWILLIISTPAFCNGTYILLHCRLNELWLRNLYNGHIICLNKYWNQTRYTHKHAWF